MGECGKAFVDLPKAYIELGCAFCSKSFCSKCAMLAGKPTHKLLSDHKLDLFWACPEWRLGLDLTKSKPMFCTVLQKEQPSDT